jgi:Spy/CpxP family protein refolding chaperone
VNDQNGRYARLRRTAMGALAALLATGAIAAASALAANGHARPHHRSHHNAALVSGKGGTRPTGEKPTPPSRPGPAGGKGGTQPTGEK